MRDGTGRFKAHMLATERAWSNYVAAAMSALVTASGSFSMTVSRTRAAPSGLRSQLNHGRYRHVIRRLNPAAGLPGYLHVRDPVSDSGADPDVIETPAFVSNFQSDAR